MKNRSGWLLSCTLFILLFAGIGQAADKVVVIPLWKSGIQGPGNWIGLNVFSSFLDNGASFNDGFGRHSGIFLPDGSSTSFTNNFSLPPNYTAGTDITIHLTWHTGATNCDILFRRNAISVARIGQTHIQGPSTTSGMEIVGGEIVTAPAIANESQETLLRISPPDGSTDLEPGDSVSFNLYRAGGSVSDTCAADMVIQAITVSYEGN